ncbi:MAG: M56 family metallopeptidase [Eubacteriales bacterium]
MESIFLAVINMSLTASYIIPFVLLARLLLQKAPKIYSYSLWSVVLFRLLCPFSLESALSLLPEEAEPITRSTLIAQNPEISTGIPIIDQSINPILPTAPPSEIGNSVNPLQIWTFVAQMLWGFGAVLMLLVASVSLLRLKKKLRVSKEIDKGVFLADDITSPFVFGVISPKIYLPSTINEEEIPLILAHERFHLKRFDHVTRLLSFVALTLHWFNPLVWISYYLSEKDMETSCDEGVLREKSLGERGDYATALLKFTGRRTSLTPLAFSENDTKGRVKNIMKMKKYKMYSLVLPTILVFGLIFGFSTNQKEDFTIPRQIADLSVAEICYKIGNAVGVKGSDLKISAYEDFPLSLNENFEIEDNGLKRFYYFDDSQYKSRQLLLFHEKGEGDFFITDGYDWTEQGDSVYSFTYYFEALKYLPQDEILALSPIDVTGFSIYLDGDVFAYEPQEREIYYTENGMETLDSWLIPLVIQPYRGDGFGYSQDLIYAYYAPSGVAESNGDSTDGNVALKDDLDETEVNLSYYARRIDETYEIEEGTFTHNGKTYPYQVTATGLMEEGGWELVVYTSDPEISFSEIIMGGVGLSSSTYDYEYFQSRAVLISSLDAGNS